MDELFVHYKGSWCGREKEGGSRALSEAPLWDKMLKVNCLKMLIKISN